jgi:hypothetical protein
VRLRRREVEAESIPAVGSVQHSRRSIRMARCDENADAQGYDRGARDSDQFDRDWRSSFEARAWSSAALDTGFVK